MESFAFTPDLKGGVPLYEQLYRYAVEEVRSGRLGAWEMERLMREGGFDQVVDATHPYAAEVTENLRAAAHEAEVPYVRLVRDGVPEGDWLTAADAAGAADLLEGMEGGILLTTGS